MIVTKTYPANRLNNVFDDLFSSLPAMYATQKPLSAVSVNVLESANGYHLDFNAPGRNKEDFAIKLEDDLLTVSYEKKEAAENKDVKLIRKEFTLQSFKRSFSLDEKINTESIEARYENGILKVYLPKKEVVKNEPKQISIH